MPQLIFLIRTISPGVFQAEIPGVPEATVTASSIAGVIAGIEESWQWWCTERRAMLKGGDDPAATFGSHK